MLKMAPSLLPTKLWLPPVDFTHLNPEEQELVRKVLIEESTAFAYDNNDIGCIPSLQMSIKLIDDTPVQKVYASIPKPMYK